MLSRARTAWCPLVAVLLVVLGGFCGPAVADTAVPPVSTVAHVYAGHDQRPGCGKGGQGDAGQQPVSPPRSGSAHELLPALYEAHGASGAWSADQAVLEPTPLRGPPPLTPPSPVDLSVLRV
ncbi:MULTISPECIES: hypothetical protein [Streptomyces]|uniref:hypothetical protein n=1 Tax=Streptomyces TaxID=1883 RepID=UPI001E62025B|nr:MULTISPECIES: hypothetical protein [Streptomyces]UFQ16669.1 hypothetical protein J2N69_17595 [Streptomyces huasconensis]WCL86270.1 hypothetical protein PPN52_17605 [Streptomyces sp. JCM 35825]